jgi:hypothetical protein
MHEDSDDVTAWWAELADWEIDTADLEDEVDPMPAGRTVDEAAFAYGWWEPSPSAASRDEDDRETDAADAVVQGHVAEGPAPPTPLRTPIDPAPGVARARPADDAGRRVDAA